jgi:hypothetical protein
MANGILNFDPEAVEQDIIDFYGGNAQQIAQPDASYFSEFALPSTRVPVNAPEPQPDAMPVMSNPMPPAFMGASTPPITVNPLAFLNGVPATNLGSLPREIQDAIDILNRSSVSTRKRKSARNTLDEFNASLMEAEPAPDIPIPDLASQRDVLGAQPSEIEQTMMELAGVTSGQPTLPEGDRFKYGQADATGLQRPVPFNPAPQPVPTPIIEQSAMEIAAADPRAMLGGQATQPEMAAVSTPIDRSLQMRIQELEALNDGRVPNMGFMGMRF